MKQPAVISTLLDRQAGLLDAVLREQPMDIIAPRLFAETARQLGKKHRVKVHIIEDAASSYDTLQATKQLAEGYSAYLEQSSAQIKSWLEDQNQRSDLADRILNVAQSRTTKLLTLYRGLDVLAEELDIKALLVNQEYMIHEATLVNWAKHRDVPSVHFCHCPYTFRSVGSMRHFVTSHMTLTSERCNLTLDDMQTGQGERQVTGLINWDAYRDIGFEHLIQINEQLDIPDDALVISFFTAYAFQESACADPETYEKSLDAFLQAAAEVQQNTEEELFFIVKDRPSGIAFGEEQVRHKAKKFGLEDNLAYLFIRPEVVVARSDITISCGSGIAMEGMALGKPTIELVIRQTFLANLVYGADDGVIQCEPSGLAAELQRLVDDEDLREDIADQVIDKDALVEPTQLQQATQESAAYLLDILGNTEAAEKVREADDFYDHLEVMGQDARFHQTNAFQVWRSRTQPKELAGQLMGERYNAWKKQPSFHLVMVVDQSLFSALANTLDTLELQMYPHFGLSIISADPCPDAELLNHPRIQWIHHEQPFERVNQVIEDVEADWVMPLWPGDELQPHGLFHLADYADLYPDWLVMYGDEVLITPTNEELSDDASRFATSRAETGIFKPDFNLDLLRSTDYVGRAVAFRKDAWQAMDGLSNYAYRQAEDLVFRIAERMTLPAIGHVPQMLVHRSTLMDAWVESADYEQLGALIRQQHLQRCGFERAEVLPGLHAQIYNTRYHIQDELPPVDLLIAGEGLGEQLASCLRSLQEQQLPSHAQLYITSPATEAQNQQWLIDHELYGLSPIWVPIDAEQASIAQQWQALISASQSEHLLLTWDRLRCIQADWLTPLQDQLGRDDVAMVAPRLVSARATLLSAGQILGKDGLIGDLYRDFFLEQEIKGLPRAWCEQNFNALNPACVLMKRSALLEHPIDLHFTGPLAINDLQLQLCTQGKKLMWTPLSSVLMTEIIGLGSTNEQWQFKQRWFNLLLMDPAFNPHLELRAAGLEPDILLSAPWHPAYRQRAQWLCVVSDPYEGEFEASASLLKAIEQQQKQEQLQSLVYQYTRLAQERPLTLIELARRAPSVVIYFGRAEEQLELVKETAQLAQIEQWVVVTEQSAWDEWQAAASHIAGYLVTDPEIFAQQAASFPCVLIASEENEQLSRAQLWVEQKVQE